VALGVGRVTMDDGPKNGSWFAAIGDAAAIADHVSFLGLAVSNSGTVHRPH
jgi:hypothetical protein